MELKERVKAFLADTGATTTNFCKRIGISTTYYYKWMNNKSELSDGLISNIESYLKEVYTK